MSTQIGDMQEMAVSMIVLVTKIGIIAYFAIYLIAGLNSVLNNPLTALPINLGHAAVCGGQKGLIGFAPLGGCS